MQNSVAEIQGLYGPFTFQEKLLQQIWSRRDFNAAAATTADGRPVAILNTGKWNHHGGPDFKNARVRIGGSGPGGGDVAGDIEVHIREGDWQAHGHAADPAYANVVLHVVLFPPRQILTAGAGGRAIPVLALLPLLNHDLEQYAADAAIERLAGHPLAFAEKMLSAVPPRELSAVLAGHAERRWRRKIHYARLRVERLGWEDACHHTALEILGYSANRSAMLAVATAHPLGNWAQGAEGSLSAQGSQGARGSQGAQSARGWADEIYGQFAQAGAWAGQSSRPANHPRARLRQYAAWVASRPDWPEILRGIFPRASAPKAAGGVAAARRALKLGALRKRVEERVCANAVGGTRIDTLITDGFFPLLAARCEGDAAGEVGGDAGGGASGEAVGEAAFFELWKNWFAGDMPGQYPKLLREFEITGARGMPLSNGAAQGLLGFLIEAEAAK